MPINEIYVFQAIWVAFSGAALLAPLVATPFVSEAAVKQQSLVSCNPVTNVTVTTQVADVLLDDIDLRIPFWTSAVPCVVVVAIAIVSAIWTRISKFEAAEILDRSKY